MPVADPRAGRLFVWLISCFILLSLVIGGAFLVVYMTQPDPATFTWLLYSGMALVCFPWSFWFMLYLYRCISRSLGLRIVCGGGGGGRDGAGSIGRVGARAGGSAGNGDGRHVKFGEAVVVNGGSGNDNNNDLGNIGSRSSSSSSSNNDISFKSHESEIPLASAMASW